MVLCVLSFEAFLYVLLVYIDVLWCTFPTLNLYIPIFTYKKKNQIMVLDDDDEA